MTRITLNGQGYGTGDNGGPITIDRTFPGVLGRIMSEHEWTSFCDKIDEALAPAGPLRKKLCCYRITLAILLLLFMFLPMYSSFYAAFVVSVSILVSFCMASMRFTSTRKKLQDIKKKVEQLCQQET